MFRHLCYVAKNAQGYYYGENGELVFENSFAAKKFHFLKEIKEELNDLENWDILEVEFGFSVIRSVDKNEIRLK